MNIEDQLLEYWRKLPTDAQQQVLEFTKSLQADAPLDSALDDPEHLTIKSRQQLDRLLQEGLESGDPIEMTDAWWAEKRNRLFKKPPQAQ